MGNRIATFEHWYQDPQNKSVVSEMWKMYKADKRTGELPRGEAEKFLAEVIEFVLKQHTEAIPKEKIPTEQKKKTVISALYTIIDTDHNGNISLEEFSHALSGELDVNKILELLGVVQKVEQHETHRTSALFNSISSQHSFIEQHFATPTFCALCSRFIWGLGKHGSECQICNYPCHNECIPLIPSNCSGKPKTYTKGFIKNKEQKAQDRQSRIYTGAANNNSLFSSLTGNKAQNRTSISQEEVSRPYTINITFSKLSFKDELNQNGKYPVYLEVLSGEDEPQCTPHFRTWEGEKTFTFQVGSAIGILCSLYVVHTNHSIEVAQYVIEDYAGSLPQFYQKPQNFADFRGTFELSISLYHSELYKAIEEDKVPQIKELLENHDVLAVIQGTDSYVQLSSNHFLRSQKIYFFEQIANPTQPYHLAAKYSSDPEVFRALFTVKDLDCKQKTFKTENTPVHFMHANFTPDVYKEIFAGIIERGCPLNVKNVRFETPLVAAVARRHMGVITGLLKSGFEIGLNDKDEQGNSCLHYAALVNDYNLFRLLQENSASIDLQNNFGKTPLDIAAASSSLEMKQFVQRGGFRIMGHEDKKKMKKLDKIPLILESELTFEKKLASGAFGDVWKGVYRNTDVAIKVLKGSSASYTDQELREFKDEILVNGQVDSPYIVQYFGICLDPLYFVMQFCHNGSLYDVLKNTPDRVDWYSLFHFTQQSIKAVLCLHNQNPPIIHRDIKSKNFMVSYNMMLKIGDFGLSRQVTEKNKEELKKKEGSPWYMAPEVYECKGATTKSDVYALAVVFWEMLYTCMIGKYQIPYAEYNFKNEFVMCHQVINNGKRPKIPKNTPGSFAQLISVAWDSNLNLRPEADALNSMCSASRHEWEQSSAVWESKRENTVLTAQQFKALKLTLSISLEKGIHFLPEDLQEELGLKVIFRLGSQEQSSKAGRVVQNLENVDVGEAHNNVIKTPREFIWEWNEVFELNAREAETLEIKIVDQKGKNFASGTIVLADYQQQQHVNITTDEFVELQHADRIESMENILKKSSSFLRPAANRGSLHLKITTTVSGN